MSIEQRLEKVINNFTVGGFGELQIRQQSVNFIFKKDEKVVTTVVVLRTGHLAGLEFDDVAVNRQLDRVESLIGGVEKPVETPVGEIAPEPTPTTTVAPVKSIYKPKK